jgi:hypothetical protein
MPRLLSKVLALHEFDDLAVRPGHECDPHLGQWILAQPSRSRFDTGHRPGGQSSIVGRIGIGDPQAKMQNGALGSIFVGSPPPSLGLNGGAGTEHLHEPPISGIEERSAVDPARDREREMHAEPEALGIEPDRFIEIDRPDRHVMEAGRRPETFHTLLLKS